MRTRTLAIAGLVALTALLVVGGIALMRDRDHGAMHGSPAADGMPMAGMGDGLDVAGMVDHGEAMPMGGGGEPFDRAFIDNMTPHHEAAIAMARIVLERGQHPELKELAREIVDAQSTEVAQLRAWRRNWYGSEATPSTMPMAMPGMDVDALARAEDVDRAFLDLMIPHHQGAVLMARAAVERAEHPELRTLGQAIIDSQTAEIARLETWREAWYPG